MNTLEDKMDQIEITLRGVPNDMDEEEGQKKEEEEKVEEGAPGQRMPAGGIPIRVPAKGEGDPVPAQGAKVDGGLEDAVSRITGGWRRWG